MVSRGATRAQRTVMDEAMNKCLDHKAQAFADDGSALHPTPKQAVLCIQCDPPNEFANSYFTRLKCASGNCNECPAYERPTAELTTSKRIKFYSYEKLPNCSKCGALPAGTKTCTICAKKKDEEEERQIVNKDTPNTGG